jgi:hypothetical protein
MTIENNKVHSIDFNSEFVFIDFKQNLLNRKTNADFVLIRAKCVHCPGGVANGLLGYGILGG